MDPSKLPEILASEYPWLIRYGFERTSSGDGQYECDKAAKTLKSAFNYAQNGRYTTLMDIDLTFEEVINSEFPLTIWKTKDYGIIEWVTISRTTPEDLSYLLLKSGQTKVVSILNTRDPNVVDCEWLRPKNLLNDLKVTLNPPQIMENGDTIQIVEDSRAYFLALVSKV